MSFAVIACLLALLDPIPIYLQDRVFPDNGLIFEVRAPILDEGELVFISSTSAGNGNIGAFWDAYVVGEKSIHQIPPVACFHAGAVYVGPYLDLPKAMLVYMREDSRHGRIYRMMVDDGELTSTLIKKLDFESSETAARAEYDALFPQAGTVKRHAVQEYLGVASFTVHDSDDPSNVTTSHASSATLAIDFTTSMTTTTNRLVPWD